MWWWETGLHAWGPGRYAEAWMTWVCFCEHETYIVNRAGENMSMPGFGMGWKKKNSHGHLPTTVLFQDCMEARKQFHVCALGQWDFTHRDNSPMSFAQPRAIRLEKPLFQR